MLTLLGDADFLPHPAIDNWPDGRLLFPVYCLHNDICRPRRE
jgi:hypothetical protein